MVDITTALQQTVLDPIVQSVNSFILAIPSLLAAILIIILGYLVGKIIGKFVQQVLETAKLDEMVEKFSKSHPLGKVTIAELCGKLVMWYIVIAFVANAAEVVQLGVIARLLLEFSLWAPHLIAAIIIMAIGLFVSELAKKEVSSFKAESSKLLGLGAKYFVIIYFAVLALGELGLNVTFAQNTILVVIAGVMLTFAIGFGLALKDHAEEIFAEIKKAMK